MPSFVGTKEEIIDTLSGWQHVKNTITWTEEQFEDQPKPYDNYKEKEIQIEIPNDLHTRLNELAIKKGKPLKDIMLEALKKIKLD